MAGNPTESDLSKMGLVEISPGVFRKPTKPHPAKQPVSPIARKTPMLDKALNQPAQKFNPKEGLYAKGRLKKGVMNKTESSYAQHLNALKFAGEISQWWFEAIKLKLADNTSITIDFAILYADGRFVFHDVKGHKSIFQDDAKAKMKIAAEMFPFEFFVVFPRKQKDGGGWDVEQINPDKNK